MTDNQAISIISKYSPCPHDILDRSLGNGTTWAKCQDCGVTVQQKRVAYHHLAATEFDEAIDYLQHRLLAVAALAG